MLPDNYLNIAPLLTRRQNEAWAISDPRVKAYFRRYEDELPRHSLKLVVPVVRETVNVKLRDRDRRESRQVRWDNLLHHVRKGHIKKIMFRHVVGMQHHVDIAFSVVCGFFFPIPGHHLRDTVMRTDILPNHWEWVRIFLRMFSEARSVHVQGQLEAFLTYSGFEHALEPRMQPVMHTAEFFWMSDVEAAPRFVDWFLAPSGEDREVRFTEGSRASTEIIRLLYERVLREDMPVFNRCVLVVYQDPGAWTGITGEQLTYIRDLQVTENPKPNPRTWARFCFLHHASYITVVVDTLAHASL